MIRRFEFYFGGFCLGVILSIVAGGLGLDDFDKWVLIVAGGLFYYATSYPAEPSS